MMGTTSLDLTTRGSNVPIFAPAQPVFSLPTTIGTFHYPGTSMNIASTAETVFTPSINQIVLIPLVSARAFSVKSVSGTVNGTSGETMMLVYDSAPDGTPLNKVGSAVFNNTAGLQTIPFEFTFARGVLYWIGSFHGGVVDNIAAISTTGVILPNQLATNNVGRVISRSAVYPNFPSKWNFSTADLGSNTTIMQFVLRTDP